jgi:hypothetical protein
MRYFSMYLQLQALRLCTVTRLPRTNARRLVGGHGRLGRDLGGARHRTFNLFTGESFVRVSHQPRRG